MATFDSTLGAAGTTGWVLPKSAQTNPSWIAPAESAYGVSQASQESFKTYVPYHTGIIQDISATTIVNGATKCFVSANLGTLVVLDASATYNVTISDNQTLSQVSLAYDNILDFTLNEGDSVSFLNAFTTSGFKLGLPTGVNDQFAAGATCAFNGSAAGVADVLANIITNATDASGDTAALFLADTLNAVLTGISTGLFKDEYIRDVNPAVTVALRDEDLALGIDVSSSVVTIDAVSSAGSVTTCYDANNANLLVNQVDSAHINAYKSDSTNGMTISAFPGLAGDQFVFGLKSEAPQVRFLYNKATSSAPNDLASLDLPFGEFTARSGSSYAIRDNNWVLAFRVTLSDNTTLPSRAGYHAPVVMNKKYTGLTPA
jgi:hypothetical protein